MLRAGEHIPTPARPRGTAIDLEGTKREIVEVHVRLRSASVSFWSGTFLGGYDGEGGPALLEILSAAVRAGDAFLAMLGNGQSLRKSFLAVTAEEFVEGHTDLHRAQG